MILMRDGWKNHPFIRVIGHSSVFLLLVRKLKIY